MNIKQKLSSFNSNEPRLHIFREGLFAKLYNESAYLFEQNVRAYKIKVTESKRGRYYSLGFPISRLNEILSGLADCEISKVDFDYIICSATKLNFDNSEYIDWCSRMDKTFDMNENSAESSTNISEKSAIDTDAILKIRTILDEIKRFRIDSSTPTECMLYFCFESSA